MPGLLGNGEGSTYRRLGGAAQLGGLATRRPRPTTWRGGETAMRAYKRPVLELPVEVISGASEPHDGIAGIAAAVRRCLSQAGGPADVAFASIAQARGTAAAIRLARAYVDIRAGEAA